MKRIIPMMLALLLLAACTPKTDEGGDTTAMPTEPATDAAATTEAQSEAATTIAITLPPIDGIETDEEGGFILPTIPI